MPWPWLGHSLEIAALVLFGWCWLQAVRARSPLRWELFIAVLYGWVLETLDMWIFGSYHYGPGTWWWIRDVPLYIPLLWALILHASMELSDRLGLPVWARPFADGLLALLIDIAIDAIAIRVGLWHWAIPLNEGWFGVPAGNLCAWMWVAAWYGAITRLVRWRIAQRGEPRWHALLVPVVAYAGLILSLIVTGRFGAWMAWSTPNERLRLFALQVVGFFVAVVTSIRRRCILPPPRPIPSSLIWSRWLMHSSFALVLGLSGVWRQTPALIAICAAAIFLEWVLAARLPRASVGA